MAELIANIPENHLPGITAARNTFNAGLAQTVKDEAGNDIPNPAIIETDEEYFDLRAQDMVASWATQYGYTTDAKLTATVDYLKKVPPENREEIARAIAGTAVDISLEKLLLLLLPVVIGPTMETMSEDRLQPADSGPGRKSTKSRGR